MRRRGRDEDKEGPAGKKDEGGRRTKGSVKNVLKPKPEEDEDLEIPMVSPEEFAEEVEDIIESEPQEAKTIDNQFQEPITPPSVARPGSIASMMEAIAKKEQVLANAVKEVEQVLDEAIELVAEYKKSVITQTSAIREKLE